MQRVATVNTHEAIREMVRAIPPGRVTTYGAVARRVGCNARVVGYAMAGLPTGTDVPWHRVLNASGRISIAGDTGARQRALLEAEGVRFDARGRVDFERFGWSAA